MPDDASARPRRSRRKGWQAGWKFTLHMPSYLPGAAVRRQPRTARPHVPRLRHARLRIRQTDRTRQRPADRRILELRHEEARMLGYATSPKSRWCPRWPTRRRRCSAFLRDMAPRPSPLPKRTSPNCALSPAANSAWTARTVGHGLRLGKAAQQRATLSPTRK
jgi:oligopeptidase A